MLAPGLWPRAAWTLGRTFGARGIALRALHEGRRVGGLFRPAPRHSPGVAPAPGPHPFRVDPGRLRAATDPDAALRRAERVLGGEYEAYRWDWRRFPHDPGDWLRNPVSGAAYAPGIPWWKVEPLAARGDIKDVWEPARFAWAYDLVRGFIVSGDGRFAAAFHHRLDEWLRSSPPFQGPHWACGQEAAVRAAALLYAEASLASAPPSTPEAMQRLAEVLAASGERIADALGYAVSQRNNHGISEAAGLVLLGARFRGSHPDADRWLERGRCWLERLIREQFAPDGWYIQHSFTYLRVALDQCVLAARGLRAVGDSLSPGALERLRVAVELLLAVMDPETGIVPNHGANDGAFVHPVTLAPYRDFRPVLTAACATFGFRLPRGVAADAEVLAWLGLDPPAEAPPLEDGVRSGESGWAVARVGRTSVFVRAGSYSSRPGHLDPLHLDVRVDGVEVVVDAGTYAYNGPPPWRNGLTGAGVHNGPLLDGREPGVRGPRFLWYIWPSARLVRCAFDGATATIEAERPGEVRRVVRVSESEVTVRDEPLHRRAARMSVRWLLHPEADSRSVIDAGEGRLIKATEGHVVGWFSPRYGERIPSRVVELACSAAGGATLVSRIAAPPARLETPRAASAKT